MKDGMRRRYNDHDKGYKVLKGGRIEHPNKITEH